MLEQSRKLWDDLRTLSRRAASLLACALRRVADALARWARMSKRIEIIMRGRRQSS